MAILLLNEDERVAPDSEPGAPVFAGQLDIFRFGTSALHDIEVTYPPRLRRLAASGWHGEPRIPTLPADSADAAALTGGSINKPWNNAFTA